MRMIRRLWSAARNLIFRSRRDRDLDDELQSYLDLRADELGRHGVPPEMAARRARLDLGGIAPVTESVRASRAGAAAERAWADARYALRGLRRTPGFAAVAIGTLALGIGANLAVFAVVDAALLKPLPYAEPNRLVDITQIANPGTPFEVSVVGLSWVTYNRWRAETRIFDAAATYRRGQQRVTLDGVSVSSRTYVGAVSSDLLQLLGVQPLLGRWFNQDDGQNGNGAILLAESFWRSSLGADRSVVGRSLVVDGRPHLIVGVMPATFRWSIANEYTIGWRPYLEAVERAAARNAGDGPNTIFRLRDGLPFAAAERELDLAAERHKREGLTKSQAAVDLIHIDWRDDSVSDTDIALLILWAAAAIVVLVACANVANLVLARQLGRSAEIAVRGALGATRGRIAAQLFTENLVLAGLGGIAGWWVLTLGINLIPRLVPAELRLFAANPLALDARALTACVALVLLATVFCSVPAALRVSSPRGLGAMTPGLRLTGETPSGGRLRGWLLASQVALTVVLLSGSSLLGSSLLRIVTTDVGFNSKGLGYVTLSLPRDRYSTAAATDAFFDALKARVRALPSVRDVVRASPPPAAGLPGGQFVRRGTDDTEAAMNEEGTVKRITSPRPLRILGVEPDFFRVVGLSLVEGRLFAASDTEGSEPVALLDESSARFHWPGQSAIGKQFRTSALDPSWITIVGVVRDVKLAGFHALTPRTVAYFPAAQLAPPNLLFRTDGDLRAAIVSVQEIVRAMDPQLDRTDAGAVTDLYGRAYETPRFYTTLMALFAGLALLTSAVGLFGVLSFMVSRRRREIGIRIALGAGRARVRALVVRDVLTPVVIGAAAGLVIALWLTRYLASMLYQITPTDPVSYLAALGALVGVATVAAWLPARSATRVDPAITLRE